MRANRIARWVVVIGAAILVPGCQPQDAPVAGEPKVPSEAATTTEAVKPTDIERPDVFQSTETGLWDGRPSLGGVWVAHPNAQDPERVIIRNTANGNSVVGALFRRARHTSGPALQVSAEAAAALGMLPGQPADLSVTALRPKSTPAASDAAATGEAPGPLPEQDAGLHRPFPLLPGAAKRCTPGYVAPPARGVLTDHSRCPA